MTAYGQNGIPHAFIVDREGNIAWHGHPMADLEKTLQKLASAPVVEDPQEKQRSEGQRKLREFTELAARGDSPARLDALAREIAAIDKECDGIEPGQKLDLNELRRAVRFQSLMRDYQRAVAAGKPVSELAQLEQTAAPLAPAGFKFEDYRDNFNLQRTFQEYYRAITGKGDAAQIELLTRKLELVESTDVDTQTEIAWTLLTDEKIKIRNSKLALKFARAAFDASDGKSPDVLDTYARALFDNGNVAEAVQQQERAITLNQDEGRKVELEETLKRYQKSGVKNQSHGQIPDDAIK